MTKLLLASLLLPAALTVHVADADSSANAPRPAPRIPQIAACKPSNKIIFQIDRKSDVPKHASTSHLEVDSNGAWSYVGTIVSDARGTQRASGCLAQSELDTVKQALKTAVWKTSMAQLRCMAFSSEYTEYRAGKQLVLTQRMCDGVILDAASQKSLKQIEGVLGALGKPTP